MFEALHWELERRSGRGSEHLGLPGIGPATKPDLIHPGRQGRAQHRAEIAGVLDPIQTQQQWCAGAGPAGWFKRWLWMVQQRDHPVRGVGGGHGGEHLRADRLHHIRPLQLRVHRQPALGGNQPLWLQLQAAALLEQMGALEQQQLLLTATAGLVQGPHLLHQGIAAAADEIERQCQISA